MPLVVIETAQQLEYHAQRVQLGIIGVEGQSFLLVAHFDHSGLGISTLAWPSLFSRAVMMRRR